MQYSNDYNAPNASNSYVLTKLPQPNPIFSSQPNPIFSSQPNHIFSSQTNTNFFPPISSNLSSQINTNFFPPISSNLSSQISPNYLPTIIPSNEATSQKPQYVLIQEPKQLPQSSDLMFKNIIQDIILQIFKNYSEIHNKLLLDKEFINNITIQISQKLAQDTNLVHNLSDQISQELVKTLPKKLLQDNDFSKDFIDKIYKNIKEKLESSNKPAPEQATTEPTPAATEKPALEPAAPEPPAPEPEPATATEQQAPIEQQAPTEPVAAEQTQQNNKFKKPLPANLEEIPSIDYLDYFYSLNKKYFDDFKSDTKYIEFQKNTFNYSENKISTIFNEDQFKKFIESYKNKDEILAKKILKYFANLQIFTINDLLDNIKKIAKQLADEYYNDKKKIFIFILFSKSNNMSDIINGSHFWTLLLLYKYLKEEPGYDKERTFFVKDVNNLKRELEKKYSNKLSEYDKKYIFIDDASYQGRMLSGTIGNFITTNKIDKNSILPIIPFYHNKSEFEYKDQSIIGTVMINPFYTNDKNYNDIFNDIDLVVKLDNGKTTTLTTLLGINKYNLPVIFEYNLGDSKNTYTCLFEYGPVFNNITGIYKEQINIKPESDMNWDNYCKKVISVFEKQSYPDKLTSINSTNNTIENIKIFDLPGEINLTINTDKYTKCDGSSFITKRYGKELYDSNSKEFIDIFDKINLIYDKNGEIKTTLTELITN